MTDKRYTQTNGNNSRRTTIASKLPFAVRLKRFLGTRSFFARRFKDAWILIDRDTQADDNAEHLYRYIQQHQPYINVWFVLRKTSNDWARLKKEGFKLLAFGSFFHRIALLHARHVVSSQCHPHITNFLPSHNYSDLVDYDFTYLQHGVAQHDQSRYLNARPIDMYITSAPREYDYICANDSPYRYTQHDVALTGLPRHDRLFFNCSHKSARRILIMPTWRASLVGTATDPHGQLIKNPDFVKSNFYQQWSAFIQSPKLIELANAFDHEVSFFPHPELRPYIDEFDNDAIAAINPANISSMQDILLTSSILITDFSSIAFDMAYMNRPVIYFQFDKAFMFGGGHTYRAGYLNYDDLGFGPVVTNVRELLGALESILTNNSQPYEPYDQRMKDFFAYRDGQCCARVFNVINSGSVDAVASAATSNMAPNQTAASS